LAVEAEIIQKIRSALGCNPQPSTPWLRLGLGDDAAILRPCPQEGTSKRNKPSGGREWVLSCDAFLEGVHFRPDVHGPRDVGYKALARATSDLAAMGARPRFFLLNLVLPGSRTGAWLDRFLLGLREASRKLEISLVGGDTSRLPHVAINIMVGGDVPAGHALTRSGARPGDLLFVRGTLGAAQLGLGLIQRRFARSPRQEKRWNSLLAAHLRPAIGLDFGRWLSGDKPSGPKIASAAIDTSDGLSTDLEHLCESSGVGARIWAGRLPLVRIPPELKTLRLDPLQLALHGGEDYQLLFTVPRGIASQIPRKYQGVSITHIGEITRGPGIELVQESGRRKKLTPQGWDPFRKT
jgi:thiamine-monophosphate kinase